MVSVHYQFYCLSVEPLKERFQRLQRIVFSSFDCMLRVRQTHLEAQGCGRGYPYWWTKRGMGGRKWGPHRAMQNMYPVTNLFLPAVPQLQTFWHFPKEHPQTGIMHSTHKAVREISYSNDNLHKIQEKSCSAFQNPECGLNTYSDYQVWAVRNYQRSSFK